MVQFISINPAGCTGCRECEMICSLYHFGECNPERSAVRVMRNEGQGLAEPVPVVCQQCDEPACLDVCPDDAIYRDIETGLVKTNSDACTGCEQCVSACSAGCIFMDAVQEKAIMCDLCGGEPQCVAMCHSGSLQLEAIDIEKEVTRVKRLSNMINASMEASNMTGEEK